MAEQPEPDVAPDTDPDAGPDAGSTPGAADRALPDPGYDDAISAHEERLADARRYAIEAGRRKGGLAGAAMAGAMFAVADIVDGPKKDDKPVTVESATDPDDVDRDGIEMRVGEVDVGSPALPSLDPVTERAARKPPQV
ncbi:MAG: hypothetical protein CL424_18440 [Acidimicrobiaceae bacterium]|nr:hypothetical protein [Acidimicrobiaceae bacterium]